MNEITTMGIDLAKSVLQLNGRDGRGNDRLNRQVRRGQVMESVGKILQPGGLVAMEACGGAHYWGRRLRAAGYQVKLIAPQHVKRFAQGNKNDRNDAQAISEAALREDIPRVALKSEEQQAVLALHRIRSLIDKQRKQLSNQLRGILAEFGVCIPQGFAALHVALREQLEPVPVLLQGTLREAGERLKELQRWFEEHTARIEQLAQGDAVCKRLMQEPGVGPLSATAFVASLGDPAYYRNGRQVSACLAGAAPAWYGWAD